LIKYLKHKLAEFVKSNVTVSMTDYPAFKNNFESYFNKTSNKNQTSWIFACMDVWGKHFAGVNFRLYEESGNGENREEVYKHPIVSMFKRPNQFQTWWEIKYRFAQHFGLYGNGYLYKLRNGLGLPMSLIQLLPGSLTAKPSNSGIVEEYQYTAGHGVYTLSAKDIIHFKYPDPDNLQVGKSIISNIANEVEVNQFQSAYQKQFYKQGGFLGLIFTTDQQMGDVSFNRAKSEIQNNYTGDIAKGYKAGLFDQGLKPIASPYSIKDMDISSLKKLNMEEICAAFQVNKFMFGMAESINRATAQEVTLQFTSGVIEPIMNYFDVVLTQDLAMEFGKSLCIQHDNTSPRDQEGELAWYESMTKTGSITPNEIRIFENLDPLNIPSMDMPIDLNKQVKINQTVN